MSSLPTRSRALTGAREKPCGRALSPSKNWQTSVRRFGRSSDNKSTYETRSPSLQAEREDLELYHSQAGCVLRLRCGKPHESSHGDCSPHCHFEEFALPLRFPGTEAAYRALYQLTSADIVARATTGRAKRKGRQTKRSTSPTATTSAAREMFSQYVDFTEAGRSLGDKLSSSTLFCQ
jgi:hypothetical protein